LLPGHTQKNSLFAESARRSPVTWPAPSSVFFFFGKLNFKTINFFILFLNFYFGVNFVMSPKCGDDPLEDLAKFGYKINMKVFKNVS
jgi:hypothetical protein